MMHVKRIAFLASVLLALLAFPRARGEAGSADFMDAFSRLAEQNYSIAVVWEEEKTGGISVGGFSASYPDDQIHLCKTGGSILSVTLTVLYPNPAVDYTIWNMGALTLVSMGVCDLPEAADLLKGLIPWKDEKDEYADLEYNEYLIGFVRGERTRASLFICKASAYESLVWQPLHGGNCYHQDPCCSKLDGPRLVSLDAAIALGFRPCGMEKK